MDVLTLVPQTWSETIQSYGVIEAVEEILVTLDYSGQVESIHFEEGNQVKSGQVLIKINNQKRKLRLDQTQTAVKDALARLEDAKVNMERIQKLYQSGDATLSQLDNAKLAVNISSAHYENSLAAKRIAEEELKETTLFSPVNGLAETRTVNPGETVIPGETLAKIQAVDTVRVVTYVSEKDINHLRIGAEATMTTPAVKGVAYQARIESLGAKADPKTGNFQVKLTLSNEEGLLRPGMTAAVTLSGIQYDQTILIPEQAIVDRNRRRVVFTLVDDKAKEIEPLTSIAAFQWIPVFSGLQAGDRLIINGVANIVDNSPVQVSKELTLDDLK